MCCGKDVPVAEIEAALSNTTTTAPEGVKLTRPTPSGMVRLRFTGTGPTYSVEFGGEIKPGEFDCPEPLAMKFLASRTGDYVLASGAASDAEVVEALSSAGEPEPAEKRKERK